MTEVVEGIEGFEALIKDTVRAAQDIDYTDVLDSFTDDLEEQHAEYFATESGPDGERWEPWFWRSLSASDTHPTLDSSGELRESLLPGNLGHVEDIQPDSLTWGTDLPYAGIHQEGAVMRTGVPLTSRGGIWFLPAGTEIEIPQRKFVGMNEALLTKLQNKIADHVVRVIVNG